MSLFRPQKRLYGISSARDLIPGRPAGAGGSAPVVTTDSALRQSAVWACLRLRANVISTLPVDVLRKVDGVAVEMPKPPILVQPGGERVDILEWLYSTQVDLDRCGNVFGLVTERNALNLPGRIDLQPIGDCAVVEKPGQPLRYRIGGKVYEADQVWHEKQYTVAGLPVGLSPIAYAAWTIGQYLSAQQFATQWYGDGGVPKASLRNTVRPSLTQAEAETVKSKFKAAIQGRDLFVTGREWEYKPIQAEAAGSEWIEAQRFGVADIARFFDVPGDLIDAAMSGSSITYANVVQRHLQFLILHMQAPISRREAALTRLLPRPRYVKLNANALLRMDPETQARVIGARLEQRTITNAEARALYDAQPLTPADLDEFRRVYGRADRPLSPAEVVQKAYLGVGRVLTSDEARELINAAGADLPIPGPDFGPAPATPTGVTP